MRRFFYSMLYFLSKQQTTNYCNDPKFSDRQEWANSADPNQTVPREEQSDQGLHCLTFYLHLLDK